MSAGDGVALLAEGVDRNSKDTLLTALESGVALLAEGVDRNFVRPKNWFRVSKVALLAEGVDRNAPGIVHTDLPHLSPSSRRAWIEIV